VGLKFGWEFANHIHRRMPRRGDRHLDEVVIRIAGKKHWLRRAVDQKDYVLDVLVQSRRDKKAAKRLLGKLLRKQERAPCVLITDKLKNYAAKREIIPGVEHRQHKGLNNRTEKSHQPSRRRERIIAISPVNVHHSTQRAYRYFIDDKLTVRPGLSGRFPSGPARVDGISGGRAAFHFSAWCNGC
jgi:transposase-like protein